MSPVQIAVVAGVALFFFFLLSIIKIVQDFERLVVLRFGKYQGTRGPGIVYVLPLGIEKPYRVDMREKFLDPDHRTCFPGVAAFGSGGGLSAGLHQLGRDPEADPWGECPHALRSAAGGDCGSRVDQSTFHDLDAAFVLSEYPGRSG